MRVEEVFTLAAPREQAAALFADVHRVAACIPGVEGVEQTGPDSYDAVLAIRLGPIKASFAGALTLDDSDAPERFTASGQGRDRATGSMASVAFTANLAEAGSSETTVSTVADVTLRGRMAQFGTGVVRAAAGEMVREFSRNANDALAAQEPQRTVTPGTTGFISGAERPQAKARQRGLVGVILRGLLAAAIERCRRFVERLRGHQHDDRRIG